MAIEHPAGIQAPVTGKPGVPRRMIFGIVAIGLFMSSVDSTIVATALPAIHASLRTTINWAGWTITIYNLGMVIVLPIAGKISDERGRRRIFFWAVVLFTAASLLCGLSTNIYLLIAFRAVQAFGGGALQPSAAGIVAEHFGKDRDRAIGMFGTIASGGQVLGPVIGGVLVCYLSWRWIFFVNVPIGLVLIGALAKFVPESPRTAKTHTDFRGLALMAVFILSANTGITSLGTRGTTLHDPAFLMPVAIALAAGWLFIRHTRRSAEPFIPMRLLRAKGFAVMNSLNLLWGMVGFGVASLAPLYAQDRYGLSALNSGTLLAARGVGAIVIGAAAAMALRRTGYRLPLAAGFAVVAAGLVMMAAAPRLGISPYLWLSIGAAVTGLGNGMANPASRNACLQVAPDEVAAITGLRQMFVFMGVIFSISTVTAILNRSADPGMAQAHVLWVVAGILVVVMMPLVVRVPEHKGNW
ncbi:MAG: MFS transporter [Streptosporangiales bacterium]|nr:MFS transporter [Streptosporangiales bacterium]